MSRRELLERAEQMGKAAEACRKRGMNTVMNIATARAELAAWHAARMPENGSPEAIRGAIASLEKLMSTHPMLSRSV